MQQPPEGQQRPPQPPYYPPPGQQYGTPPQYPQQQPYYPPPGQQMPPPRKKRRRWPILLLVGALLLCAIIGIVVATSPKSTTTTTTGGTTATSQATTVPTKASSPASQPKWTTTHTFSGNGTKKTAIFSVPADWKMLWSCTGQNIGGVTADGVLGVSVYGSDNGIIDPGAVNATCKAGSAKTAGETEEHQSGSIYLSVDATGDWTVQVQELK